MTNGETLKMIVVYRHPLDHPTKYVARVWEIGGDPSPRPTAECYIADTLEEVRRWIPCDLVRLERDPNDEPQIVECWV